MKPGSFKQGGGDSKAYPVLSDGPNFLRPFLASLVARHFGQVGWSQAESIHQKSKMFAECVFAEKMRKSYDISVKIKNNSTLLC